MEVDFALSGGAASAEAPLPLPALVHWPALARQFLAWGADRRQRAVGARRDDARALLGGAGAFELAAVRISAIRGGSASLATHAPSLAAHSALSLQAADLAQSSFDLATQWPASGEHRPSAPHALGRAGSARRTFSPFVGAEGAPSCEAR